MIAHGDTATANSAIPPETVVIRVTRRQLAALMSPFAVLIAVVVLQIDESRSGWRTHAFFAVIFALFLLEMAFIQRYTFTRLTADGIERRAGLYRRFIPWSSVASLQIERRRLTKYVAVYERSGRRTRLRYPVSGFAIRDRDFEQKIHTIGQWWLAHCGKAPLPQAMYGVRTCKDGSLRIGGVATQGGIAALLLAWLGGNCVVDAALAVAWRHPHSAAQFTGLAVPGAVALLCPAAAWRLCLHASVVLDGDVMRVRRAFAGPRDISAREIRGLTALRRRGGLRFAAELGGGELVVLPKPRVGLLLWDEDFGRRTAALHAWWLDHRGEVRDPTERAFDPDFALPQLSGMEAIRAKLALPAKRLSSEHGCLFGTASYRASVAVSDRRPGDADQPFCPRNRDQTPSEDSIAAAADDTGAPWESARSWLPPVWRRIPVYAVTGLLTAQVGIVAFFALLLGLVALVDATR